MVQGAMERIAFHTISKTNFAKAFARDK